MAQDNVQKVKERLDIVDVVGSKVQLRRAGRNFKGLCPFHQEKTPSFVVFPETQGYHCFGCGKNGDILSFIMDTENLTFRDALEQLAQRAGVTLENNRPANPERDERRQRLIELHERAASYFSSVLWDSSSGRPGRELVERRGIDRKTAEIFGLGFAPDSWDALKIHLQQSLNASEDSLVEAGLCSRSDSGRVYDRFRNRLMFPIRDRKGRTIGFGARALGDEMPKYLNSPQTPLFDKSSTLYALDRAFDDVRKTRTLVVVEGYMDAIAAHQFGFENAVASMGTALTDSQVSAIKSYVDKVYVALDSDAAGQLATIRAIDTLREGFSSEDDVSVDPRGLIRTEHSLDAEIRIVVLEEGKDPDDLIRSDTNRWRAALENAVPLVEYILKTRLSDVEDSPAARAEALRSIAAPVLREIRDPIVQSEYIDLTANLLGYKESVVRQSLGAPRRKPRQRGSETRPEQRSAPNPEKTLVGLLLRYPLGYAERSGTVEMIRLEIFRDSRHREIVSALREHGLDVDATIASLASDVADYATSLQSSIQLREDFSPGMANNEIIQALASLEKSRYDEMMRQTQADIQSARESGDLDTLRDSILRMAELANEKARYAPKESPYFKDLRSNAS
ncbi:MAG: DNA primase [Thermomicrobiales bacterium]